MKVDCVLHSKLSTCLLLAAMASGMLVGCAAAPPDVLTRQPQASSQPHSYSDADWAEVLRRWVRGGSVDYDGLAKSTEVLDRYMAAIGAVGPTATPHLFPTGPDRVCYYINAYNALAVRTVLAAWPAKSVHRVTLPPFERQYRFAADGEYRVLEDIRRLAIEAARGDARVIFTLCDAAKGSPSLAAMPYRSVMLEQQLRRAAAWSIANPAITRVDHQQQALLLGQVIFAHKQELIKWYQLRYGVGGASLLNVLLILSDKLDRERLNSAVGYKIKMLPFDRSINSWTRKASGASQ
jgi:hypothetical protein